MPVRQISEGLSVEAAHVYVIPPNATVTLNGERFHLATRDREGRHNPADRFFTSLAEARGDAAVAVVLSGGDADGSLGVQAIKPAGSKLDPYLVLINSEGKTVAESMADFGGGSLEGILVFGVIGFIVLMPFFALREIGRDIGDDKLFEQFFVRRTPYIPLQP